MDATNITCVLCGHEFKYHNTGAGGMTWFCTAGNCPCDEYIPTPSLKKSVDVQVPIDTQDDSYRWN